MVEKRKSLLSILKEMEFKRIKSTSDKRSDIVLMGVRYGWIKRSKVTLDVDIDLTEEEVRFGNPTLRIYFHLKGALQANKINFDTYKKFDEYIEIAAEKVKDRYTTKKDIGVKAED